MFDLPNCTRVHGVRGDINAGYLEGTDIIDNNDIEY